MLYSLPPSQIARPSHWVTLGLLCLSLLFSSPSRASEPFEVPTNLDMMLSLGSWKLLEESGQIRLIGLTKVPDPAYSAYQLVWMDNTAEGESRVKARSDITEWSDEFITSAAHLNQSPEEPNKAVLIRTLNRKSSQVTDWVLYPHRPGTYRLFRDEKKSTSSLTESARQNLLFYYVRPTF